MGRSAFPARLQAIGSKRSLRVSRNCLQKDPRRIRVSICEMPVMAELALGSLAVPIPFSKSGGGTLALANWLQKSLRAKRLASGSMLYFIRMALNREQPLRGTTISRHLHLRAT